MNEAKLKKWLDWLAVIEHEIRDLVMAKHMFHEVQKMIDENPRIQTNNVFYSYFANTYVSHTVMGVRRQIKSSKQSKSISFKRLLEELPASPAVLTRTYFVSLYKNTNAKPFADEDFNCFCEPDAIHIDPDRVRSDLEKLNQALGALGSFADKRVAHFDEVPPKQVPSFNELDACIGTLDELCVRYLLLFRGQVLASLLPTIQYDWKEIFRTPWISSPT